MVLRKVIVSCCTCQFHLLPWQPCWDVLVLERSTVLCLQGLVLRHWQQESKMVIYKIYLYEMKTYTKSIPISYKELYNSLYDSKWSWLCRKGFAWVCITSIVAGAETIITTDQAVRGGKIIELKKTVDEAVKKCPTVSRVFMSRRTNADVPFGKLDISLEDVCFSALFYETDSLIELMLT